MTIKFILILHMLCACLIIIFVLLNKGKGSEIGATFGTSQESIFGSQGSNSFLKKIIITLAVFFVCINISINIINKQHNTTNTPIVDVSKYNSLIDDIPKEKFNN